MGGLRPNCSAGMKRKQPKSLFSRFVPLSASFVFIARLRLRDGHMFGTELDSQDFRSASVLLTVATDNPHLGGMLTALCALSASGNFVGLACMMTAVCALS